MYGRVSHEALVYWIENGYFQYQPARFTTFIHRSTFNVTWVLTKVITFTTFFKVSLKSVRVCLCVADIKIQWNLSKADTIGTINW